MKNSNGELFIPDKAELIWLVSIIFTEEFLYRYDTSRLFTSSGIITDHNVFLSNVIDWVYKNDKALKLLQDVRSSLVYEDGEVKPKNLKNQDIQSINSLSFLRYVEKSGIQIPSKIIKAAEYLIEIEHWEKSAAEDKKRKFPELSNEEFELLKKEPLWTLFNAILYVNKIKSTAELGEIALFIQNEKGLDKLSLYITQANKTGELILTPNSFNNYFKFNDSLHNIIKPDYNLIGNHSVKPVQFIEFVKNLPLQLPIFDNNKENQQSLPAEKPLHKKEKDSLLKLFIGMAVSNYGLDSILNDDVKASEISKDVRLNSGIDIDDDTVRKHLKAGLEILKKYQ